MDGAGGSKCWLCWLCWLGRGRVVPTAAAGGHTGKHLKPTVCSQTKRLKLESSPLKHTSVLTRSILRFGYRCDPFGLENRRH